jgi:hypothetical protein
MAASGVCYSISAEAHFYYLGKETLDASVFPLRDDITTDADVKKIHQQCGFTFCPGRVDVAAVYKWTKASVSSESEQLPEQDTSAVTTNIDANSAATTFTSIANAATTAAAAAAGAYTRRSVDPPLGTPSLVEYRFFTWWNEVDEEDSYLNRVTLADHMDTEDYTGCTSEMTSPDDTLEARILEGGSKMRREHTLNIPAGCTQLGWVFGMKDAICHLQVGHRLNIDPCEHDRSVGLYSITEPDALDPSEYRLIFELYPGVNEG